MIEVSDVETFFHKYVAIGVAHDLIPGKLFFYFGYVNYVDNAEVKLETKNGFKIIPLGGIMDIHLAGGNNDR